MVSPTADVGPSGLLSLDGSVAEAAAGGSAESDQQHRAAHGREGDGRDGAFRAEQSDDDASGLVDGKRSGRTRAR